MSNDIINCYGKFADYQTAKTFLRKNNMVGGIIAFGSARIPDNDPHIKEIEEVGDFCAKMIKEKHKKVSFITGGGPSVMKAWLKPAHENGIISSGLGIKLPHEQKMNEYTDDKFSFVFETLEARKAVMYKYARAVIIFKGGFGTMDELFAMLTLIATGKLNRIPILVYPSDYYKDVLNFDTFLKMNTIREDERELITLCKTKNDLKNELTKIINSF